MTRMKRESPMVMAALLALVAPVLALADSAPRSEGQVSRSCGGLGVFAHRGDLSAPENSLRAITAAANDGWPGVELDLQSLADGAWALHHDPVLGLKTDVAGVRSTELTSEQWRMVRLRDRNGALTNDRGAFLSDVIGEEQLSALTLNMEVKEPFVSCARTTTLLHAVDGRDGRLWFFTSVDPRHLSCLRDASADQYLGLVVLDPDSAIKKVPGALGNMIRSRLPQGFRINDQVIAEFARTVPPPAGLHVELSVLEQDPSLPERLQQHGLSLMAYSKRDSRAIANALLPFKARFGDLIRGAIIEGDWRTFCTIMEGRVKA